MMLAVRLVASVIDIGAMLVVACLLAASVHALGFVRVGQVLPPAVQPWRDLVKLSRKRRLRPDFASPLYPVWPVVALASTVLALLVVPGFAGDLIGAPLANVPVLIGLLALGRAARVLAALESGAGRRGLAGAAVARDALTAEATWLVALGALAVAGDGLSPLAAVFWLAIPAILLAATGWRETVPGDYAGIELGLFAAETILRRVVLLAALIDIAAPFLRADAVLPWSWPAGLLVWFIAMLAVGIAVALLAVIVPRGPALRAGFGLAVTALLVALDGLAVADEVFLWLGLIGFVLGFYALVTRRWPALNALALMQAGVAAIGVAVGASDAATLIVVGLVLIRLASWLSDTRWVAVLCVVALAGLPPFGLFAGDFVVVRDVVPLMPAPGVLVIVGLVAAAIVAAARVRVVTFERVSAQGIAAGVLLGLAALLGIAPGLIAVLP